MNIPKQEAIELWVGLAHEAHYYANNAGIPRPIIISRVEQLFGYHGPLTVHFCGNWWKLEDASDIRNRLQDLKDCGDQIKTLNH